MTPSLFDFSESGFLCHQVQLVEIVEGGKTKNHLSLQILDDMSISKI